MREPMESRKEQKRQSLLDAAYALFTEKGVAKTSVDEIVRGANVAKGTFYLYFHDKDQLLGQLVYNISAQDRKSTRLNSSHPTTSRMPSSA